MTRPPDKKGNASGQAGVDSAKAIPSAKFTPATAEAANARNVALRYAEAGYRVLPVYALLDGKCTCSRGARCKTPGKHPIEKGWQSRATTEPASIHEMFDRYPDCHIGIMPPEGHCILDVDPRNGGEATMKALLNGHGKLPATPKQSSGGGGLHIVMRGDPGGPLGDGIDIKRPGSGFVVAYPALHASGGTYKWREGCAPWEVEPAPLPDYLRAKGTPTTKSDPAGIGSLTREWGENLSKDVADALKHVDADLPYPGWVTVLMALQSADPSIDGPAFAQADAWSRKGSKYQEGDCEKHWRSFKQGGGIRIESLFAIAKQHGWEPSKATRQRLQASTAQPDLPMKAREYNLSDMAEQFTQEATIYVKDLLPEGLTLCIARYKLGKTDMMLQLAACINSGKAFLGLPVVKQARVAFLALEEGGQAEDPDKDPGRNIAGRVRAMGNKDDLDGVTLLLHLEPRDDYGKSHLQELIDRHDVILIDSMAKLRQVFESANSKAGQWNMDYEIVEYYRNLVASNGKALVLLTHAAKGADSRSAHDAVNTTGGTMAAADGSWTLQTPDKDNLARVRLTAAGRNIRGLDLEIRKDTRENGTRLWSSIGGWINLTKQQQEIFDLLAVRDGQTGVTYDDLAEQINSTARSCSVACVVLRRAGLVRTTPFGVGPRTTPGKPRVLVALTDMGRARAKVLRTSDFDAIDQRPVEFEVADTERAEVDPFDIGA